MILQDFDRRRVGRGDGLHLGLMRLFSVHVTDDEGWSKVAKDLGEDSGGDGVDEGCSHRAAFVVHGEEEGLGEWDCDDDDGDVGIDEGEDFGLMFDGEGGHGGGGCGIHRDVLVEFCQSRLGDLRPGQRWIGIGKVFGGKVEVSTEVVAVGQAGVAEGDGGDAREDAVLGHFGTESGQAEEEGAARHHASLGFVAHDVQLSRVQFLVHCYLVMLCIDLWFGLWFDLLNGASWWCNIVLDWIDDVDVELRDCNQVVSLMYTCVTMDGVRKCT